MDRDIKINVVLEKTAAMQGVSVKYRKTVLSSHDRAR